jgi:predicted MFS family arabinose efflux permease
MTTITHAGKAESASGLARYRQALRTPGGLQFAIPGFIGRLPMGMLSLAQVLVVVASTGRYGVAGGVSATGALLYAVVTPRIGRLADRLGQARVLRPLVLIFAASTAAFAACAAGRAPVWALFVTGGLSRGTMPALGSMVRSRWSELLRGSAMLDAAFALEGIADELIFIIGPVLVVALATLVRPVARVLAIAALSVAGVLGLTRQRRSQPVPRAATSARGSALRSPGLRVLVAMHVCLGALFAAVELATIAFAAEHGARPLAGALVGLYGLGSAVAGVWYGTRRWRASQGSRLRLALAATVLGVVPLAFVSDVQQMALAIVVAGLGISVTLISSYSIAEACAPAGYRTEGMSWLTTAASVGTGLGAPVAGSLIDSHGAFSGYVFAFAAGLAAVGIVAAGRRHLTPRAPGRAAAPGAARAAGTAQEAGRVTMVHAQ